MKNDFPTNDTIRQYLLGKLDNQSDLEERLSEQILLSNELSEIVDSIEDEIIEDYLDGTISADERTMIEEYFLRPAERREKLQLSVLLRNRFKASTGFEKKKLDTPSESASNTVRERVRARTFPWYFQARTWCELAALVFIVSSGLIYMSGVRDRLNSQLEEIRRTQMQLEDQLTQERQRSASLTKQMQEAQPPVAILTFLGPVFRANEGSPAVEIRPWTQRVRVEVDLRDAPPGDYDVRLETEAGRTIWSKSGVTASAGGLRFEMPAQGLSAGAYCFTVGSRLGSYCFRVRDMK
jgi:anti-sigma factor RsiW